jgi:3-oxoacyl-[acyl-carrier protein] reductase
MEFGLEGRVALVTGSSRGIGRGIAEALAEEGCNLVLVGRDTGALAEVESAIRAKGRKAISCAIDLRDPDAPTRALASTVATFGGLDILVNNAGGTKRGNFIDILDADWRDGFELKFFAHVRLSREAWPLLKSRSGSLVTIGGTSGRTPHAGFTIGSSVNAACIAFTKALADLGKEDGVQVNAIHPSHVETDRLWKRLMLEVERTGNDEATVRRDYCRKAGIRRFGKPEDVAALVAFIVSKRGSWLHGATIDMDGGEVPAL